MLSNYRIIYCQKCQKWFGLGVRFFSAKRKGKLKKQILKYEITRKARFEIVKVIKVESGFDIERKRNVSSKVQVLFDKVRFDEGTFISKKGSSFPRKGINFFETIFQLFFATIKKVFKINNL